MADQPGLFESMDGFQPQQESNGNANRVGRPKGARGQHLLMAEKYLKGFSVKLLDELVRQAMAGDSTAMRLCIERIYPRPLKPPATIELPEMHNRAEMLTTMQGLIAQGARGDVDLSDAVDVVKMLGAMLQVSENVNVPIGADVDENPENARKALADRLMKAIASRQGNVVDVEAIDMPADCVAVTETPSNGHVVGDMERKLRQLEKILEDRQEAERLEEDEEES